MIQMNLERMGGNVDNWMEWGRRVGRWKGVRVRWTIHNVCVSRSAEGINSGNRVSEKFKLSNENLETKGHIIRTHKE